MYGSTGIRPVLPVSNGKFINMEEKNGIKQVY